MEIKKDHLNEILQEILVGKLHIVLEVINKINSSYNTDIVTLSNLKSLIESIMKEVNAEICFIKPDCEGVKWYHCDECARKVR